MTAPSPTLAPEPTSATAFARAVIEGQVAALTRLTQIGMEIAEDCGHQCAAPSAHLSQAGARDPGLAFARVARAVRMTIALQSRLLSDLAALDQGDRIDASFAKQEHRLRLRRLVDRAAEESVSARRAASPTAQADDWNGDTAEDEIESLSEDAYERLTDAEDGDFSDRPFAEVVASICGDLGLSPDWTARLLAATVPPPMSRPPDPAPPAPCPFPEMTAPPPHPYPSPSRGGRMLDAHLAAVRRDTPGPARGP